MRAGGSICSVASLRPLQPRLSISRRLIRWQSTTTPQAAKPKPYYVTTPIFYVNAPPHIGHLYTLVLADTLKRWHLLKGEKAILCTGVDEHGIKVQQAAARHGVDTQLFCDQGAESFQKLAGLANISYDHFVRTTDSNHRDVVQYVWTRLQDKGYIYRSEHEGWYAVSDETFYTKSGVHLIQDPRTGRTMMASKETGSEVEWISESNYFFRLSSFRDQLLDFYRRHPNHVMPEVRTQEIIQHLEAGIDDLSISRPAERLSWGIQVPGDETQTIYVWFDALINYLAKAGYIWPPGEEHARGWPADCHVIGKEIVRFHGVYWPAILMALGLPLPKRMLAHGHWTLGHRKMSKSTNNVVNPFFAMDRFDPDTLRFYLVHEGGIAHDPDYDNAYIIELYRTSLKGALGNLASRITRNRAWNIREAVRQGASGAQAPDAMDALQLGYILRVAKRTEALMQDLQMHSALRAIMQVVHATNKYLQHFLPWHLDRERDAQRLMAIAYHSAEALRVAGILLQPFMPGKASELLDMLGVASDRRTFAHAQLGADDSYGTSLVELGVGHQNVLFPPLRSHL